MTMQNSSSRSGVAIVEFAVCLPVIVLLMLGAVEAGRALMVQHALQEAAQAGCRVYSVKETPSQKAVDVIEQSLDLDNISGYTFSFDPAFKSDITSDLQPVTVTASVEHSKVAWLGPTFMGNAVIRGQCIMPADLGADSDAASPASDPESDDNPKDGISRVDDPSDDDDDDDDDDSSSSSSSSGGSSSSASSSSSSSSSGGSSSSSSSSSSP